MTQADPPRRILLIRPSALGDVCRTVPVLASLRRAFPEAAIDWLVQSGFEDAIRAHPDLTEVVSFPRGRFGREWHRPGVALEIGRWLRSLRRRGYDLVVDAQGLGRSGLLSLVTGAARRVGPRSAREMGWLGYTIRSRPVPGLHTVDEMLSLLAPLGVPVVRDMRLHVPDAGASWWAERRRGPAGPAEAYAVLAPTSRWPSKRWPAAHFRELIAPLVERGFDRVVLVAGPGEDEQVHPVIPEDGALAERVVNLAGTTTVGQTMAIIAEAGLVVANDSAPLHMAVGFDRPCVGIFGATDPDRVGPYRRADSVVRGAEAPSPSTFRTRRLGDRLMRPITVAAVIEVVEAQLRRAATGGGFAAALEEATP
jgi:lipopolysaccharide heptosyltransferase I